MQALLSTAIETSGYSLQTQAPLQWGGASSVTVSGDSTSSSATAALLCQVGWGNRTSQCALLLSLYDELPGPAQTAGQSAASEREPLRSQE